MINATEVQVQAQRAVKGCFRGGRGGGRIVRGRKEKTVDHWDNYLKISFMHTGAPVSVTMFSWMSDSEHASPLPRS